MLENDGTGFGKVDAGRVYSPARDSRSAVRVSGASQSRLAQYSSTLGFQGPLLDSFILKTYTNAYSVEIT